MACRCGERGQGIRRAVQAVKRGEVREAVREIGEVRRTLVEDAHNGDLVRAGAARLAAIRARQGR
jgi:hypothetical protein